MSSSSASKRFFKIILCSTLHDHKLNIPEKFVKKYGHELSDLVRLMVPTGGIWCVKLEKTEKTIWLHDGMDTFIKDNSIGFGYCLIFKYKGNSTFKVRIFDLSVFEIEYPNTIVSATPNDVNELPVSGHDEDDDDNSIEILRCSMSSPFASGNKGSTVASAQKRKVDRCYVTRSKKLKIEDDGGIEAKGVDDSTSPRKIKVYHQNNRSMSTVKAEEPVLVSSSEVNRTITSSTNRKNSSVKYKSIGSNISPKPEEIHINPAIQAANISLPKNPVYSVTMKSYNIRRSNVVRLPAEFCRLYMSNTSKYIKLQDTDDNEWEVHCTTSRRGSCFLSKGWKDFVKAKNLMVGDVCIFEPVRINEEVKLKVKIARAL